MRIAIFSDAFLPQINGVVTSTLGFAKGLAAKGHKILIIAAKPKEPVKCDFGKNISVKFVPSARAFFYEDFRITCPYTLGLVRLLKKFKVDVIHFETQFTLGLEAILCAKILKVPLVGTFHTYITEPGYLKHVHLDVLLEKYKFMKTITWGYSNFFYNHCNLVISPSFETKRQLEKYGVKKPITVLFNGIDLQRFKHINLKEKKRFD
jgi:glycosyltransferase involved in cell wall biosynthesis